MSYTCCDCPYVGRTERVATRLAQLAGYVVFIDSRDGNHFVRTRDFRTDRINFAITDGVVRWAEVG
jgi:hypothetical protein